MRNLVALLTLVIFTRMGHPYYMAVTELSLDPKTHRIGGSLKLFISDIEDALTKLEHHRVDLVNPKDSAATIKLLSKHLASRFSLAVDGKAYPAALLGFEKEEDIFWLYLEGPPLKSVHALEVTNTVLYDFLKTQIHILHFTANGQKQTFKMVYPDKSHVFTLSR